MELFFDFAPFLILFPFPTLSPTTLISSLATSSALISVPTKRVVGANVGLDVVDTAEGILVGLLVIGAIAGLRVLGAIVGLLVVGAELGSPLGLRLLAFSS